MIRTEAIDFEPGLMRGEYESVFDFLKNLSQAHQRSGGLIIDFGTPARHKYTLGDWMSGFQGDFKVGGRTYSNVTSDRSRFFFDLAPDEISEGTITLSAMAGECERLKVVLNNRPMGEVEFSRKDFSVAEIEYEDNFVGLRNEIRLFCGSTEHAGQPDGVRFSIDYARIVPALIEEREAETTWDSDRFTDRTSQGGDIILAEGDSLTFNLPIPDTARIFVEAASLNPISPADDFAAHLEITALVDGEDEISLADIELGEGSAELNMAMDRLEGRACSLTFRAREGDVLLEQARLLSRVAKPTPGGADLRVKNVVLIMIDTQRADHLSVYNPKTRVKAPTIESLAKQSVVFDRALAPASWTKPSITTLLSGLYPRSHTVQKHESKVPATVTLASEHLQKLGYNTAAFVANGYISSEFGFDRGWDFWKNHGKLGNDTDARFVFKDAVTWLQTRNRARPFFMYVHTIDPHAPYAPPKKYLNFYNRTSYFGLVHPSETARLLRRINAGEVTLADTDKSYLEALYDGEVSFHDAELRRLLNAVGKLGLAENTAIIVTSDHGEEFFDHGGTGHAHTLYEELLHVPLIIRLPGKPRPRGRRVDAEVGLADILPTICALLRVECPDHLQGDSLLSLLRGDPWEGFPRASFAEHYGQKQQVVRMGGAKAIFTGHLPVVFDLLNDPGETTDIVDDHPITTMMLRDALGKHLGRFAERNINSHEAEDSFRAQHEEESAVIGAETEMQLRALGYTGD